MPFEVRRETLKVWLATERSGGQRKELDCCIYLTGQIDIGGLVSAQFVEFNSSTLEESCNVALRAVALCCMAIPVQHISCSAREIDAS